MEARVERLTLQMLEWIAREPRTYAQVMDAWRTSCPRLSIWEDALSEGLIDVDGEHTGSRKDAKVRLTAKGRAAIRSHSTTL